MDANVTIQVQKNGITMHRLIYLIFCMQRLLVQFESRSVSVTNTILILAFLLVCEVVEEIFYHNDYFGKVMYARVQRYIQCLCTTVMFAFLDAGDESQIMAVALLILFMVDFFLSMNVLERGKAIFCVLGIALPVLVVVLVKLCFKADDQWMFLFFDLLMLLLVFCTEAYAFVDYSIRMDKKIMDQENELAQIVHTNENILNMQQKLKNTNDQLNIQKLDLQKANKQIKENNEEMVVQGEILRYIAMSNDVSKISNQITDSIMQVKKLGFCAVYIKKDVYLNKYPNYVIKTNLGQLHGKIKEQMEDIYLQMAGSGINEQVYHEELKEEFPFLRNVNINSVYVKVLGGEDGAYGLFMIGDSRRNLFDDNMSFYDAIIAQYDIAIANARIYNEMQNMARKDGLTGINNRLYFNELFRKAAGQAIRNQENISVALFDIDKFKSVNDTYGHLAGDEVIKRIASVTEKNIDRYGGFVCRYGGEEFVAVLPGRKLEVAQPIIEELFEDICSQIVHYNEYDIAMSVSVGLTSYPEVCQDTDSLLKRADWCMYYAKEHGRHQINVDDGSIQRD